MKRRQEHMKIERHLERGATDTVQYHVKRVRDLKNTLLYRYIHPYIRSANYRNDRDTY